MILISIDGDPIAKKRPRFVVRGGHGRAYNDQETEEGRMLLEVKRQYNAPPMAGPVQLEVEAHFRVPKSMSKRKRDDMLTGVIRHTKKPDCDNVLKFVMDVLNGTVWIDDCQVVFAYVSKHYAEQAKTVIKIKNFDNATSTLVVSPDDF